jgi:dTMP kinase
VDLAQLSAIVNFATGGLKPDLTLLLDIEVEEGLKRRAGSGGWNRLDAKEKAFYERVRHGYAQLAQAEPGRWEIVDAGRPPEQVQAAIRKVIFARLQAAGCDHPAGPC